MTDVATYEVHDGRHTDCPPCYAIKVRTIQFQGTGADQRRFTERERARDMDTYAGLRRQGYQPPHVFGSTELAAQVETKVELETGVVMAKSIRKEMNARIEEARQPLT